MASRSPPPAAPKLRILHLAPPAGLSKGLSALDLPVLPTLGGTSERLTTSADSPAQPKPGGGGALELQTVQEERETRASVSTMRDASSSRSVVTKEVAGYTPLSSPPELPLISP